MPNKYEPIYESIKLHAVAEAPRECCGLVVIVKGRFKYIPCTNAFPGSGQFIISPTDIVSTEDTYGDYVAIVHSHVTEPLRLSEVDKACIARNSVDWILYSVAGDAFLEHEHKDDIIPPYIGRTYVYGVQDCYTIIRDYYKQEFGIVLQEAPPQDMLDPTLGEGFYRLFSEYGFQEIPLASLRKGDCIIMTGGNSKGEPTHAAIYLGENVILHHPANRLSGRDVFGGYWLKNTWKCVRHSSFINDNS